MSKLKRTNICITEKQWKALKELNELSLSEHIRRAIDEYLTKHKKEKK